jgi:hypothetical protein
MMAIDLNLSARKFKEKSSIKALEVIAKTAKT